MKEIIRHRRLYAFYQSKVLNALVIIGILSLLQFRHTQFVPMPAICASVAFVLFVCYSLWLWIKKPKHIVINKWLSDISTLFVLYYLIVGVIKSDSVWWDISPVFAAIIIFFINMVKPHDEIFDISGKPNNP